MTARFWDFAVRCYDRGSVAQDCLAMQDGIAADVNLLLYCLWAAHEGRRLEASDLDRALAATASWQGDVVAGLRALRRRLGTVEAATPFAAQAGVLREAVKRLELDAERAECLVLEGLPLGAAGPATVATAEHNLLAYMEILGIPAEAAGRLPIARLAAAGLQKGRGGL